MDTLLMFPVLSCTLKALSESHLHILRLGLYLDSKVVIWVWYFSRTMSPILKSVLFGSLMGGGLLSLAVLRLSTAVMDTFLIAS